MRQEHRASSKRSNTLPQPMARRACAVILPLSLYVMADGVLLAQDHPSLSPVDLAREIHDRFHSPKSLHVKWRTESRTHLPIDNDEVFLFSLEPEDEFAYAGEKRYRRFVNYASTSQRAAGVFMEATFVLDGRVAHSQVVRHHGQGQQPTVENYNIMFEGDRGTAGQREQAMQYFEYIGSPLYDGMFLDVWRRHAHHKQAANLVREKPFSVIKALESGRYTVQPNLEQVDSHKCLVVEYPGMDKMWLAPEMGYALVKREWRWWDGGPLMMGYHNSKFEEVVSGLWLPWVAQRDAYTHPDSGRGDTVHFSTIARVTSFDANSKPQSLFEFTPVPGSLALDWTRVKAPFGTKMKGITYEVGTNLADTEAALRRAIAEQRVNYWDILKIWKWPSGAWLSLLALTTFIAFLITYVRRARQHRVVATKP